MWEWHFPQISPLWSPKKSHTYRHLDNTIITTKHCHMAGVQKRTKQLITIETNPWFNLSPNRSTVRLYCLEAFFLERPIIDIVDGCKASHGSHCSSAWRASPCFWSVWAGALGVWPNNSQQKKGNYCWFNLKTGSLHQKKCFLYTHKVTPSAMFSTAWRSSGPAVGVDEEAAEPGLDFCWSQRNIKSYRSEIRFTSRSQATWHIQHAHV